MPLTGQAKVDYQRGYMRDYMRRRRAGLNKEAGITVKTQADSVKTLTRPAPMNLCQAIRELPVEALIKEGIVRPEQPKPVRPAGVTDSQWNYIQMRKENEK